MHCVSTHLIYPVFHTAALVRSILTMRFRKTTILLLTILHYSFFFNREKNQNYNSGRFTLLIYSFLLKILSYMLHYIKILIRLLFYKIYFKIIAMNLFKKKKNPSGLDLPKTYPDVRNLPRRSTCIIESNELIQLRWYHSFPSRGSKHDDAQLNVHTMRFRISVPITVSNGEITQTRINLETH